MCEAMERSMVEMAEAAGWRVRVRRTQPSIPGSFVHESGTARMGDDPARSVVNAYGQCWEAPNLFLCGGAVFPTIGWQNPSLTMLALTIRTCRFIEQALTRRTL
jgi:choline dehydrogenase-like flavoprotein